MCNSQNLYKPLLTPLPPLLHPLHLSLYYVIKFCLIERGGNREKVLEQELPLANVICRRVDVFVRLKDGLLRCGKNGKVAPELQLYNTPISITIVNTPIPTEPRLDLSTPFLLNFIRVKVRHPSLCPVTFKPALKNFGSVYTRANLLGLVVKIRPRLSHFTKHTTQTTWSRNRNFTTFSVSTEGIERYSEIRSFWRRTQVTVAMLWIKQSEGKWYGGKTDNTGDTLVMLCAMGLYTEPCLFDHYNMSVICVSGQCALHNVLATVLHALTSCLY